MIVKLTPVSVVASAIPNAIAIKANSPKSFGDKIRAINIVLIRTTPIDAMRKTVCQLKPEIVFLV